MCSIVLTLAQARRLAVSSQLLPAPRGTGILDVARRLGYLQLDPTNAIARSHELVLWSRLGVYDTGELERLRWEERTLYEYDAAIVPTEDFPIHADTMRRFPAWGGGPMWQVDNVIGVEKAAQRIKAYESKYGARWKIAPLLDKLAAEGGTFAALDAKKK